MKLQRLSGALLAALLLVVPAHAAEQSSYVTPIAGPMSMATFAGSHLNPALRAIATCHNGSSAPANGPSSAPLTYQCWVDTTANPSLYKIYDGASWITLGSINTSTHVWLPYLTGGISGGIPYFSASGVMASSSALNQNAPVIGGGAGATPSSITAGTDDQVLFGRTGNSPLFRSVTGDVTFATGVSAIGPAKVTSAMLRNSGALSVIGRSANSSGVPADISCSAGADGVLRENGSTLGCGTIATGGIANNAVTNAKLRQGGALSVIGRSANSTGDVADISCSAGADGVLRENGSTLGCGTIATGGIANNAVTNAKAAQQPAFTFKGNNSGSTANAGDVDIAALTTKASPAAGDYVMLSDQAAAGAWKKATVSSVGSAGSVSSIAGNTGAFTLSTGITNSANDIRLSLANTTLQATPADPAATSSASAVMMGLGSTCKLTPAYSTRMRVSFVGRIFNNTAANVSTYGLRYGSGSAPANGVAATGTATMTPIPVNHPNANDGRVFFAEAVITGLTPSTQYWFDLQLAASANTSTVASISCNAMEF